MNESTLKFKDTVKDPVVLKIMADDHLMSKLEEIVTETKKISKIRQILSQEPNFNPNLTNNQIKQLGSVLGVKLVDSEGDNMKKFKIGNKMILAKDAVSALRIYKKIKDTSICDDNESILKEIAKVIAEYNKTKQDIDKYDYRNMSYSRIEEGIKGSRVFGKGENLRNTRDDLVKRLEKKLDVLTNKFETLKENARKSIKSLANFTLDRQNYGTDVNAIYNKLQQQFNISSGEKKVSKMNNLSEKVREIVGRMASSYSRSYPGTVKYREDLNAYQINLNIDYSASDRGTKIRANQVLKEVKKYWPNAYLREGTDLIYVPEKDVVKDSIKDVDPREGESKDDFINRFMSKTEKEYPDKKQRFAVALKYWNKAQDSIKDADYSKQTSGGWPIVAKYRTKNHGLVVIVKRPRDYTVGLRYNESTGSWGQGVYDFPTQLDAYYYIEKESPDYTKLSDSVKDVYNTYDRLKELQEIKRKRPLTDEEYEEYMYCQSEISSREAETRYLNGYDSVKDADTFSILEYKGYKILCEPKFDKYQVFKKNAPQTVIYTASSEENAKDYVDSHLTNDSVKDTLYTFPKFTPEDHEAAKRYGLKCTNNGDETYAIGSYSQLKKFAEEYLDYELNPDYLED